MSLVLTRVDDRLIHGQVITSWVRSNDIQVIVIVDDKIATDKTQLSVLKLSAPAGIKLYALSTEKYIEKSKQGILDAYRTMLIFANVYTPLRLIENQVPIQLLNWGGIRFHEGSRQFTKAVFLDDKEIEVIRKMGKQGVQIEHRMLQTDSPVNILSMI